MGCGGRNSTGTVNTSRDTSSVNEIMCGQFEKVCLWLFVGMTLHTEGHYRRFRCSSVVFLFKLGEPPGWLTAFFDNINCSSVYCLRTRTRSLRRCLYANEGLWEVKKGFKALLVVQFCAA